MLLDASLFAAVPVGLAGCAIDIANKTAAHFANAHESETKDRFAFLALIRGFAANFFWPVCGIAHLQKSGGFFLITDG